MKKRISLSLVAAMLFALVAMFAVAPASAADATLQPLSESTFRTLTGSARSMAPSL